MVRFAVGIPDLISFLCVCATTMYNPLIPTMQYYSLGIERYGIDNTSLVLACNKENDTNVTCKEIGDAIAKDLSTLNVYVHSVKAICAPIFVILLGGYSDAVSKKLGIITILSINVTWCIILLFNTIFPTHYPSWIYVLANGVILSLAGGSALTVTSFLIGYLSITTPQSKQPGRFGLLMGCGLLGVFCGPGLFGIIAKLTSQIWIVGVVATGLMISGLLAAIFGLKPLETASEPESNETDFFEKFVNAMKFLYDNTIDLFKNNPTLGKFIRALLMHMFSSVGFSAQVAVVSSVYAVAAPFKWGSRERSFFIAGSSR